RFNIFNKFFYIITFLESFHLCFMFIVTLSGYKIIKIWDELAINLNIYYYYNIYSGGYNMSKNKYEKIDKKISIQNQINHHGTDGYIIPVLNYDNEKDN